MSNRSNRSNRSNNSISKHPKIAATVVFTVLVAVISFVVGYKKDKHRRDKKGDEYSSSHHFWNGMKWSGIVVAVMFLLAGTVALLWGMDFWTMFFLGGDFINMIGQIVIGLISVLTN